MKSSPLTWINFLHLYQPPWQQPGIVRQVSDESYTLLIQTLRSHPRWKITMNIAGSLIEQLEAQNLRHIIRDLASLVHRGQIELVGSAMYHPLLPFLTETQIRRQIQLNNKITRAYFADYRPRGFFFPEMAFSTRAARVVASLGFRWAILSPLAVVDSLPTDVPYKHRVSGLTVIFRHRPISLGFPPEGVYKLLQANHGGTIISATDGEIYGHYHQDWQSHLTQILKDPGLHSLTISEWLRLHKKTKNIVLQPSTWASSPAEIRAGNPYAWWNGPKNTIQKNLWKLAALAMRAVEKHPRDSNVLWAQYHLDRGLSSCSWWWAAGRHPSAFGPMAWSPDEIEQGAGHLIKVIRSLASVRISTKQLAEDLFHTISSEVWRRHWQR